MAPLHALSLYARSRSCDPKDKSCKPATPQQTMIIAICFGVAVALILLLAMWWYRCLFCCSRREQGDDRTYWQRLKAGFSGWAQGGRRPEKNGDGFEKLSDHAPGQGTNGMMAASGFFSAF